MTARYELRKKYGDVYVTSFPDGREIPWRVLTVKELHKYHALMESKFYSAAVLEDEVFSLVVQDDFLKENYSILNAGVVPSVVTSVFAASAPQNEEQLENTFNLSRLIVNNIIYDIIEIICKAYPAYTPDILLELSYESLLIRLAQAERKLLRTGEITDIIKLTSKEKKEIKEDLKGSDKPPKDQVWTPPKGEKQTETTVIGSKDRKSQMAAGGYSAQEKDEQALRDKKDITEMESIYGSHLSESKDDGTIKIASYEERMAIASKRMEKNKELVALLKKKEAQRLIQIEEDRIKKEQGIQVDGRYKGKPKRRR